MGYRLEIPKSKYSRFEAGRLNVIIMGTRSCIGIHNKEENTVKHIYCHWDGYPSHVGITLLENYDTEEKINELLELGSLSSLGPIIGEKRNFDTWHKDRVDDKGNTILADQCIAHGRDRGEEDTGPETHSMEEFKTIDTDQEWVYVWVDGKWHFAHTGAGPNKYSGLMLDYYNLIPLKEKYCALDIGGNLQTDEGDYEPWASKNNPVQT